MADHGERRFVLRNEEQGTERQQQRGGEYGFALCETGAGGKSAAQLVCQGKSRFFNSSNFVLL